MDTGIFSLWRTGTHSTELPSNAELHSILTLFRGTSSSLAYTNDDSMCPEKTGHTWKYAGDQEWKDAEGGLEVKCAGQCFQSVKSNGGVCTNSFCYYTE